MRSAKCRLGVLLRIGRRVRTFECFTVGHDCQVPSCLYKLL
ncbi:hypothetical protein HHX47_DHR1001711 [Lentinula edodes]|nr:hypothetical protein HHX47_DHR1001711 [Lentinula edodes]